MRAHFILYVSDQQASTQFYSAVLGIEPTLNVPGMTEFSIGSECILGLMPETGIKRLLPNLPDPADARGIPRAELYLLVDDCGVYYQRAIENGAKPLSNPTARDWGDIAGYVADLDFHVLAFAQR